MSFSQIFDIWIGFQLLNALVPLVMGAFLIVLVGFALFFIRFVTPVLIRQSERVERKELETKKLAEKIKASRKNTDFIL